MGKLSPVRDTGPDSFPLLEEDTVEGENADVTDGELWNAFRRMAPRKAPGPDGIAGKIWTLAREVLGEPLCIAGA